MCKKTISKQEATRKRVYEFYLANRSQGKKYTVVHFLAEEIPQRTIYDIIQRAEDESGHQRVIGSGQVAKKMSKKNISKLKLMFDHKDGVSQRQAARKFNCTQPYISKTLAKKTSIRARKKIKIPKRKPEQKAVARAKCTRLYNRLRHRKVIVDDESYFTLAHTSINGNDRFYTSDIEMTSAEVKYNPEEKFGDKMLVYLAMSENGMSEPYFVPSKCAINKKIYLKKCIMEKLIPFINEKHPDGNFTFWPDLASSHYATIVTDYLRANGIDFVEKEDNPANMPECRPIEDFWSILKGHVYNGNWKAKNLDCLRRRIKKCLKEIPTDVVQRLARSTVSRLDTIRRNGIIEGN